MFSLFKLIICCGLITSCQLLSGQVSQWSRGHLIGHQSPFDSTVLNIENRVLEIDTLQLLQLSMSDSQRVKLKHFAHENSGNFMGGGNPVAFYKDTSILKIQFRGITYHFHQDYVIRRATQCFRQANWSRCNGFVSSMSYDYYDLKYHHCFSSINRQGAPQASFLDCHCYRASDPAYHPIARELLDSFKQLIPRLPARY